MKLASWLPIAALLAGFVPAAPAFGAPTGTVIINGGAAATRSSTVRLTLTATDPAGLDPETAATHYERRFFLHGRQIHRAAFVKSA